MTNSTETGNAGLDQMQQMVYESWRERWGEDIARIVTKLDSLIQDRWDNISCGANIDSDGKTVTVSFDEELPDVSATDAFRKFCIGAAGPTPDWELLQVDLAECVEEDFEYGPHPDQNPVFNHVYYAEGDWVWGKEERAAVWKCGMFLHKEGGRTMIDASATMLLSDVPYVIKNLETYDPNAE